MRRVCGVGINDVDYVTQKRVKGKIVWTCPYYKCWKKMIERCYSRKFLEKNPSYKDCVVDEEWFRLSNFICWVDTQENRSWQSCVLDKDILSAGNKTYGPKTAAFVTKETNRFLIGCVRNKENCMLGTSWKKSAGKFQASCSDPFSRRRLFLGYYLSEIDAHLHWKAKKHEIACLLADREKDSRVVGALRVLYSY